jgi:peroxiredoxin
MPSLQALHEEFREQGLTVIGINLRDKKNPTAVAQWLSERNLACQNLKATDGGPNFPSRYTVPQTFLIDRSGRLLANKSGPLVGPAPR